MQLLRVAALGLLALLSNLSVAAPQCFRTHSEWLKKDYQTCVSYSRPDRAGEPGQPVVYFLHGIRGDSTSWVASGYEEAIEEFRQIPGIPAVTFVAMDTSGVSFFSDKAGEPSGTEAWESWLIREFIPHTERTLGVCAERRCRGIAGASMGGFGALKLGLRYPELFKLAAGNSPALSPFGVYEPTARWREYFGRHPIGKLKGTALLYVVRGVFTTPEQADDNDPAILIGRLQPKGLAALPQLFFDMGDQDDYGFQEGYLRLLSLVRSRGLSAETDLIPGGKHDVIRSRAKFLLRFVLTQLR